MGLCGVQRGSGSPGWQGRTERQMLARRVPSPLPPPPVSTVKRFKSLLLSGREGLHLHADTIQSHYHLQHDKWGVGNDSYRGQARCLVCGQSWFLPWHHKRSPKLFCLYSDPPSSTTSTATCGPDTKNKPIHQIWEFGNFTLNTDEVKLFVALHPSGALIGVS